ncbi:MAG: N-succinylarginine dihydrolase [Opitutaceae bacterium]|nr:N-succinylarginine dihydrolase [Opitutaceae bacterium]
MAAAIEINFDGLVGPTHNYAGLSHGNIASMSHRGAVANPREAALQGLAKMKRLADLGLPQAVLPPHERPSIAALQALGFRGRNDAAILRAADRQAPALLAACSSASAMWVANAATVTPSADSADGRVHLTPANLVSKFHRAIEPPQTARTLRAIFRDASRFVVHEPVPGGQAFGDEGAANHTRFAPTHAQRGLHLFTYGHRAIDAAEALAQPRRFASRQALEASQAVARGHGLDAGVVVFARQHPTAIDAGVFHNDVIAVGNENVFLCHERTFVNPRAVFAELRRRYAALHRGRELTIIVVPETRVPLADAVRSYLFNSQLVTLAPGRMALIAPTACAEIPSVAAFLADLIARGRTPLHQVHHLDLRQSMHNGGGPACLRLRVVLTPAEQAALPPGVFLNATTYAVLADWVRNHYRDRLSPADLADPQLLLESRHALDELTQLLGLGSIYPFQTAGA